MPCVHPLAMWLGFTMSCHPPLTRLLLLFAFSLLVGFHVLHFSLQVSFYPSFSVHALFPDAVFFPIQRASSRTLPLSPPLLISGSSFPRLCFFIHHTFSPRFSLPSSLLTPRPLRLRSPTSAPRPLGRESGGQRRVKARRGRAAALLRP